MDPIADCSPAVAREEGRTCQSAPPGTVPQLATEIVVAKLHPVCGVGGIAPPDDLSELGSELCRVTRSSASSAKIQPLRAASMPALRWPAIVSPSTIRTCAPAALCGGCRSPSVEPPSMTMTSSAQLRSATACAIRAPSLSVGIDDFVGSKSRRRTGLERVRPRGGQLEKSGAQQRTSWRGGGVSRR